MKRLIEIQSELKAPKNQKNSFGGYNYRSCEDILEAVKPLLKERELSLVISDDIVGIEGRCYIKATAILFDTQGKEVAKTSALAREAETKKGMDEAQITGSASSYARKYALNGLFAIDDAKDPDATNTHGKETTKPKAVLENNQISYQNEDTEVADKQITIEDITNHTNIKDLMKFYAEYKVVIDMKPEMLEAFKNKRKELLK